MPTFNPRRFTEPKVLRSIGREHLLAFLGRFESYLAGCGVSLPSNDDIDYDRLSVVLASAAHDPPLELVDALYLLAYLSTDEGLNALVEVAAEMGIALPGDDLTPADVAVRIWLVDPTLLEQQQARLYVHGKRSFDYFPMRRAGDVVPKSRKPTPKALRDIERDLSKWFVEHKRGGRCEVRAFPEAHRTLFLVKHGEPLRREEVDSQAQSSLLYRPMKYDVVVHEQALGELRVNAQTVGEKSLYCQTFGKHLLGDPEFFGDADKHTLDPLRVDGEESLNCEGIGGGIDWIRLVEVQYLWPGDPIETEVRRSKDIFRGLRSRGKSMPQRPKIIAAKFEVKFTNSKSSRRVKVTPNNATFVQDDDSDAVTRWLEARDFVVGRKSGDAHEQSEAMVEAEPVLVGAEQVG